jgi:hypothetical protein
MSRAIGTRAALVIVVCAVAAARVEAQGVDEPERRASFTAGASAGDGETALALSAALGFRIAPRTSLEFEIAYARKLDFELDLCPAPLVCIVGGTVPVTGRTVSIVPHIVFELAPPGSRARVYVQAGAGIGHVRQRYFTAPIETGRPSVEMTRSSRVVAVSVGGGASMRVTRQLALGVDVRVLSLLDEESPPERFIQPSGTLRTVRLGARASWTF